MADAQEIIINKENQNMENQLQGDGKKDATLMVVPISSIGPHDQTKVDFKKCEVDVTHFLEKTGKFEKIGGDGDAMIWEVCISQEREVDLRMLEEVAVDILEFKEDVENQKKIEGKGKEIMAGPRYCVAPQVCEVDSPDSIENMKKRQNSVGGNASEAIMAVPISYLAPQQCENENSEVVEIPKNTYYLHTLAFNERRQHWLIKPTSRPNGLKMDYFYHHLKTKVVLRSLMEVYKFVVRGEIPERQIKKVSDGEKLQMQRRKPTVRGDKFIRHYVIGTYEPFMNGLYMVNLRGINYLSEREIPCNVEKKRKRENEDLYGLQIVKDGDGSEKSFFYLWEFQLINPEAANISTISS